MKQDTGWSNLMKTAFLPMLVYYVVHHIAARLLLGAVAFVCPMEPADGTGSTVELLAKMLAMAMAGAAVYPFFQKEQAAGQETKAVKGERKLSFGTGVGILLFGSLLALVYNYLFAVMGGAESSESYRQVAQVQFSYALIPALLFYAVVSPMAEELVFRGIVYSAIKRNLNVTLAVVGSAFLFGGIHGNMVQMIYGIFMGVMMALLFEKHQSLLAPVLFHGGANAAVYISTYFLG